MKYDFATVQLGDFTAPRLPLARWIEFFQLRILGEEEQHQPSTDELAQAMPPAACSGRQISFFFSGWRACRPRIVATPAAGQFSHGDPPRFDSSAGY
jgi:hypothetical protein